MKGYNLVSRKEIIVLFGIGFAGYTGCVKLEPERVFHVESSRIQEITATSWTATGKVIDLGSKSITQHGFCFASSPTPTIEYNQGIVRLGSISSTSEFSSTISDLQQETTYYIRAYLTNNDSTTYGNTLSFTTGKIINLPSVTTIAANSITESSAIINGNVTEDGGAEVTEKGFYYGSSTDPEQTGAKLNMGNGLGTFSTSLTELIVGTKYYFVAYAINSKGTAFGQELNFTAGQSVVPPTVITSAATAITATTATIGGNVTDDGGGSVTDRGILYGTGSNPQVSGNKVNIGTGNGIFSTSLSGLAFGTKYYYVAYAANSAGTSYGSVLSFAAGQDIIAPTVTTSAAESITETTARVGGSVTGDGGGDVTDRGIYYGTSSDPLTTGVKVNIGIGIGTFSTVLNGLIDGTKYYFIAYATNSAGTSYGSVKSFTTIPVVKKPTVSTSSYSAVTQTSAVIGGEVTNDGGGTVSDRGVYYGTSSDPITTGTKVNVGNGTGTFSTSVTGLIEGTKYYYVAYATNIAGTSYGLVESFTTELIVLIPTVSTANYTSVTQNSVVVGGNVTNDGGGVVTDRGVYYGISSDPTTNGSKLNIGSGTGSFSTTITGLNAQTRYYYVAYATNITGTAYGTTLSFTTASATTVADYDGNVYPTVVIGSQTWIAENLKTTHYSDGTAIPLIESTSAWSELSDSDRAYCYYNNSSLNGDTYGALYTWAAIMKGTSSSAANPSGVQGVCPSGWHVPSDAEWKELELYIGMSQTEVDKYGPVRGTNEGGKLKEQGFTHWISPNEGATNETGFTALPGGTRNVSGEFNNGGDFAAFWTATEYSSSNALYRDLDAVYTGIRRYSLSKVNGFSVRCLKDD